MTWGKKGYSKILAAHWQDYQGKKIEVEVIELLVTVFIRQVLLILV